MSSLILYTSDDGQAQINLWVKADSLWLSPVVTVKESLTVQSKDS